MTTNWLTDVLYEDIAVNNIAISPRRGRLNVVAGAGIALSGVDDSAGQQTTVTIVASGSLTGGVDYKDSVRVATTANISLSGLQTIDGVLLSSGDRVLVWQQSTAAQNGIYVVASGAWALAADFASSALVTGGLQVPVVSGTLYSGYTFKLTTADPITLGSTSLTFVANPRTLNDVLAYGNVASTNPIIVSGSQYIQIGQTNGASTGKLRFQNAANILWRNAGNTGDVGILLNGSDTLQIGTGSATANIVQLLATTSVDMTIGGSNVASFYTPGIDAPALLFNGNFGAGAGPATIFGISARTTANPGMDFWLGAGDGGTGNQAGGSVLIFPGARTGSGAFGKVTIADQAQATIALFANDATPRLEVDVTNLQFGIGVSAPMLWQANQTAASTAGQKLAIHAQNATGTTSTGGALDVGPGSGTTAGGLARLLSGSSAARVQWNDTGLGFYTTAPVAQQTIGTGLSFKGMSNAIASLLTTYGLSTSAGSVTLDDPFQTVSSPTATGNITSNTVETIGTLGGAITRTLPASPATGDWYYINAGPSASVSNVTVARNGKTINGASADTVLNTNYATRRFIYNGTEWRTLST